MTKLTKAQREECAFAAFSTSLKFQQDHLGRYGLIPVESYWDSDPKVREHWRAVVDAVASVDAGRLALQQQQGGES